MESTKSEIKNESPAIGNVLLVEVFWDEEKSNDKEFLKRYYQYKYQFWSSKPKHIGGKVAEHWKKALKSIS